jgi:hypothetical protein
MYVVGSLQVMALVDRFCSANFFPSVVFVVVAVIVVVFQK